jgi:hypothetical protein
MNMPGFNAERSLYKTQGQYQLRSTVDFFGHANTLVYPSQWARRLGGGGLSVKCTSDTGDTCTCGAGKCCLAAPDGCVCQPCGGGPTGPTQPGPKGPVIA